MHLLAQATEPLPLPRVDWRAIAPELALAGAAVVLLLVVALSAIFAPSGVKRTTRRVRSTSVTPTSVSSSLSDRSKSGISPGSGSSFGGLVFTRATLNDHPHG